jgi:hypothetical protein
MFFFSLRLKGESPLKTPAFGVNFFVKGSPLKTLSTLLTKEAKTVRGTPPEPPFLKVHFFSLKEKFFLFCFSNSL